MLTFIEKLCHMAKGPRRQRYKTETTPRKARPGSRRPKQKRTKWKLATRQMKYLSCTQNIQNKSSTVQEQEVKLEEILEDGDATQATEDAALNLSKTSTNLEKAMDPATSAAERDAAMTKATTTLTDMINQLDAALQGQDGRLSEAGEKTVADTKDALDTAQNPAEAVEQNQKSNSSRTRMKGTKT
ncbi:hypothetical protein F5Y18DRAFT_433514 [Xylariaceae sp. FL1019]|nr:hypothetical protein F5Y18DRAFT_433514 [Xylariaceae sp. FL1019]